MDGELSCPTHSVYDLSPPTFQTFLTGHNSCKAAYMINTFPPPKHFSIHLQLTQSPLDGCSMFLKKVRIYPEDHHLSNTHHESQKTNNHSQYLVNTWWFMSYGHNCSRLFPRFFCSKKFSYQYGSYPQWLQCYGLFFNSYKHAPMNCTYNSWSLLNAMRPSGTVNGRCKKQYVHSELSSKVHGGWRSNFQKPAFSKGK